MEITAGILRPSIAAALKGMVAAGAIALAVVFTNAGAAILTNRLQSSQGGTEPKYLAQGTGTNAAAVTDTALQTESAETRVAGTSGRANGTTTNSKLTYAGTITATGTRAVTEEALLDASTSGNMLIRGVFSAMNVVNGDSIAFTNGLDFVPG